jgi:hypothetical protein
MEPEHVDRASFSPDVEGRFCYGGPAARVQQSYNAFDEAGMARVEQAIQTLALPEQRQIDSGAQDHGDALKGVNCDAVGVLALDSPDDRTRHTGAGSHLRLGHAASSTQRPEAETKTDDVHRSSIARVSSFTVTWCGPATFPWNVPERRTTLKRR